ncbi:Fucose 4-O-acetylase [Arthrobacter alpinus]|uniref:Fucose 4-O-acetylase n=1 Tax=Arthrobacter alpinus TaxID=656366 RepID=A0A1H5GUB6_9MICC|nr:acyltransferase [Arthrobacter alpinus]SEE19286.1 Fucose 4-O-acetylase [Arthrobacter alpinus]
MATPVTRLLSYVDQIVTRWGRIERRLALSFEQLLGEFLTSIPTRRDTTIDIAKGLAIVAIVLGHVLRGLASSHIIDGDASAFTAVDRALYMVHLSIFTFLSGVFVRQGIEKRGTAGYLAPRVSQFLYIYLVWQMLQGIVKMFTSRLVNSPTTLDDLLSIWRPEGQLWFLPFLILVTIVAALLKPWERPARATLSLSTVGILSLCAWGYDGGVVATQGIALSIFFIAGAWIGSKPLLTAINSASMGLVAVALAIGGAAYALILIFTNAIPPTIDDSSRSLPDVVFGFICASLGVIAVIAASKLISRTPLAGLIAFLGTRSMEIFLAHIIAASGTRIVLDMAGVENPAVHIVVGTVSGIILPLLLWRLTIQWHFPWLFNAPASLTNRLGRRDESLQNTPLK